MFEDKLPNSARTFGGPCLLYKFPGIVAQVLMSSKPSVSYIVIVQPSSHDQRTCLLPFQGLSSAYPYCGLMN